MELDRSHSFITKSVQKLQMEHPIIFRKIIMLYKINPHAEFTDAMIQRVGLTDNELRILRDYGIIKRVEGG